MRTTQELFSLAGTEGEHFRDRGPVGRDSCLDSFDQHRLCLDALPTAFARLGAPGTDWNGERGAVHCAIEHQLGGGRSSSTCCV